MKIAVFGGSFNPLHVGHAMLADTVVKELGYDKILFVPTYLPPHKIINSSVTPEQRLEMLEYFCSQEGNGCFQAESCEIQRQGISYTCDTLEYLTEKYKNQLEGKLAFLLGEEIAAEFHKWKNPEKITALADLIITPRYPDYKNTDAISKKNKPSGDYEGDFKVKFDLNTFAFPCTFLENPMLPVSSTDIRQRIVDGRSFEYLVPKSIYEFIMEKRLYFS